MEKRFFLLFTALCLFIGAFAQVQVKGVVVSADDGEPLPGATVQVKGKTKIGVATNMDGEFTLNVPSSKSVLIVTYVGMKTAEVPVSNKPMKIALESNAQALGEVVVTGMGVQDKRLFTGATTKMDADEVRLSGTADVSRSLEGRVSGVQVQNVSGTFGTAPKIRVRGATSIYGTSKPLWVVDGVPLEDAVVLDADQLSSGDASTLIASAIAGLNADDIESFQILKDGSATSIYGARAMAGVIVVTTKKGSKGRSSISYTGELTYRLKPSYRDFNISNSQEQMSIYKELEAKGWLAFASLANSSQSGVYGTMYKLINTYDPATGKFGLENTQAAMNSYLRKAEFRNTDWFDLLFQNSIMQNHAVSISGGTEKGQFYTSFSFLDDGGWYKQSDVQRFTFNANASYDLSNTLNFKLLTSDSYRKQRAPGTLSQETDVVSGNVSRSFDINPYSYALNTSRTTDPYATLTRNYADFNIFDELENNYIDLSVVDVKFQGELSWKPIRGMTARILGSFRNSINSTNHYVRDNSNQAEAYRAGIIPENATIRASNPYLYTDPDDPNSLPVSVLPNGGMLYHSVNTLTQYDLRGTINYNRLFGKHQVELFGGVEFGSVDRHYESYNGLGICYENGNLPFTDWRIFKQMVEENGNYFSDQTTRSRSQAYILNGTYSFDSRYVLTGTYRYEGSNKLGKTRQSRWLPTWNISGAWNVDSEPWFQNPVLSYAKLRAGYSLTADAGPANVSNAAAIYNPARPWRQDTDAYELAISLDELANSELTYEKKHEFDLGVDLGFLHNRINLVFDWYVRHNYDLIGRVYTEGVGGIIQKWANAANLASHGVEFTLSTRNFQGRDFTWTTDFTFSYAVNKITNLKSRSRVIDLVQSSGFPLEGYPVRAIFSIPFVGLNEKGLPVIINEDGEETTHNINFQEFDKLDFLKYEGPVDAPYTGGFGNVLSWKGFHANIFLTYAFGNKLRLDPVFSAVYSDLSSMPREFMNRWVKPGDEQYTDIPSIVSRREYYNNTQIGYGYNAYNYSTARVAKGDFIRMKEVSLTYDLPQRVTGALRINNASVKLAATNVWLIYSDKKLNGQDPEFFNTGGVASPNPKQFTFTLRFGL